jgi:hypothetical protein
VQHRDIQKMNSSSSFRVLLQLQVLLSIFAIVTDAFAVLPSTNLRALSKAGKSVHALSSTNPEKPELPPIPGDYDWDTKYSGDADWLVGDAVPGKTVLNEVDLARQVTALGKLEDTWRRERIATEYQDSSNVGWVPTAELANGRFAMFFLVTGLLTELWTGVSLPGQVEELLRVSGVIGF